MVKDWGVNGIVFIAITQYSIFGPLLAHFQNSRTAKRQHHAAP